jgi:rare lipoprotein A
MWAWSLIAAIPALCFLAYSAIASAIHIPKGASRQHDRHAISRHHAKSHNDASHRKSRHVATRVETSGSGARDFSGTASYYWEGTHVATGAPYDPDGLTAAHRTLPFGTQLRVTDLMSRKSVVVTINDRGPFVRGRVLDLSRGAALVLGMIERGLTRIKASVM